MKSLVQLQQELRGLSEQMMSMSREIEALKPRSAADAVEAGETMRLLAMRYPIRNKRLHKTAESVKNAYFGMLAFLMKIDPHNLQEKLLFLHRLAAGVGYPLDAAALHKHQLRFEEELVGGAIEQLEELSCSLFLDGLLVVNLAGPASEDELKVLAEYAVILELEQEDIVTLAQLARALIHQDVKQFAAIDVEDPEKWRGVFTHHIPDEWLENNRVHCGTYKTRMRSFLLFGSNSTYAKVLNQTKEGAFVRKGDEIVSYELDGKKKSVTAKQNGVVYYIMTEKQQTYDTEMKCCVYTCSYFDHPGRPTTTMTRRSTP